MSERVVGYRFNPAPGWDPAPEGWLPPAGWQPPAEWPPAPDGWQLVVAVLEDDGVGTVADPKSAIVASGSLPALPARKVPALGRGKFAEGLLTELSQWHAYASDLKAQLEAQSETIERLGLLPVVEKEQRERELDQTILEKETNLGKILIGIEEASKDLVDAIDRSDLESNGLYAYQHPAESALDLQTRLTKVQSEIKELVRAKKAVQSSTTFTFNGSASEGSRWVADISKLMLRAFNAEAENCMKTVRAGNLAAAQKRLMTAASTIEKLGSRMGISVTRAYQSLRLSELQLAAEYQERVKEERDREREHREELREAARVEKEIEAARAKLTRERQQYLNAVAAKEAQGDEEGAARIRLELERIDAEIADVEMRAANIRAGYVYVISNVGAFGERMVKVGMTRRLEPRDRIRELGDASVPFRFDTHALIFAEDAVSLETKLHQALAEKRVNRVNLRREFFYATPAEVKELIREVTADFTEFVEFNEHADADEYRVSAGVTDAAI